jgi:hypothetical protein
LFKRCARISTKKRVDFLKKVTVAEALATKIIRNYFFAMLQLDFCFPCKWGKHNLSTKVIRDDPVPSTSTAYRDEQKSLART